MSNSSRLLYWIGALVFLLPALGWGLVFFIGGTIGAAAWWGLIGFSFASAACAGVACVLLIRGLWVRRHPMRYLMLLVLSLPGAGPLALLFGIWHPVFPVNIDRATPATTIGLPLREPAIVGWGGNEYKHNRHVVWPMERFAYDLMMEPALTGSHRLFDYGIYGADVIAPASGVIVGAYDEEADQTPGEEQYETMLGNYVYLRMDDSHTYLVLSHLKQGSVEVEVGQHVQAGELLGQVGNSGASSEPHLHLHHQRQDPSKTSMFLAEGLPLYFKAIHGHSQPKGGVEIIDGRKVLTGDVLIPLQNPE